MSKRCRRRGLGIAAVAALVLPAASSFAADKLVYQLNWLPSGEKAIAYFGLYKGFYAAEGLDVTLQSGRGSFDAITKVATGAADIAEGQLGGVMQARVENGVPVKAIVSVYTKMPEVLVTLKGSGITTFKDLPGRTVATATFTSSNAYWPVVLAANGIDPASVTLKKVDPNVMAGLLITGQADASINWFGTVPGVAAAAKGVGKEIVGLPWSDTGYHGYGFTLLASERGIAERHDVIRRFVVAYLKSLDYAVKHPDEAGAALKIAVPDIDVAEANEELTATLPLIDNEISRKDGFGALEPGLVRESWVWIAKAQNYPLDRIDPEAAVDRSFLPGK